MEADEGDLTPKVNDGTAHIAVGRTTWDLKLQDGHDYPPFPDVENVEMTAVSRSNLVGAVNAVRHAAPTDTVLPTLMLIDTERAGCAGRTA